MFRLNVTANVLARDASRLAPSVFSAEVGKSNGKIDG
jgi:hypothetical protein